MSIKVKRLFTVQCDCCNSDFVGEEFSAWNEFDDAWEEAAESCWVEKEAKSEEEDLEHYCPNCYESEGDDITTSNGVKFKINE